MHTEEQAKRLWCPFIRITAETADIVTVSNRFESVTQQPNFFNCIASNCMAWRWVDTGDTLKSKMAAIKDHREKTSAGLHEAKAYVEANPHEWQPQARVGYCGLAGQPS